jgi:hypothetical protein
MVFCLESVLGQSEEEERREKGEKEGRRENGEWRREKGEGRREEGGGRREKEKGKQGTNLQADQKRMIDGLQYGPLVDSVLDCILFDHRLF